MSSRQQNINVKSDVKAGVYRITAIILLLVTTFFDFCLKQPDSESICLSHTCGHVPCPIGVQGFVVSAKWDRSSGPGLVGEPRAEGLAAVRQGRVHKPFSNALSSATEGERLARRSSVSSPKHTAGGLEALEMDNLRSAFLFACDASSA